MRNLAAWTGSETIYPPYISINTADNGSIEITCRQKANEDGSEGPMSVIKMTRDELYALYDELRDRAW